MLRVRDVDWDISLQRFIRAGIIPYFVKNNTIFFGFGLDAATAGIGDFGGHVEAKDTDVLDAAIREYQEESLSIFGDLNREILQDCFVLIGPETAEILLPVNKNAMEYCTKFRELIRDNPEHEVQEIIWLTKEQISKIIDNQNFEFAGTQPYSIYYRIADCISENMDKL